MFSKVIKHAVARYHNMVVGLLPEASGLELGQFFGVGYEGLAIIQDRAKWGAT